ncbi:AraC family transcriptional regulator [Prolixibacteraceae bacterium JC049]|nr:AraC family transcriptional regulator [Prolixibacteraceae bacterium JC049]
MLNWENIIYGSGMLLLVVLFAFLMRLSKRIPRYIPLCVFVAIGLLSVLNYLLVNNAPDIFPHLLYIMEPFSMMYGAMIYLYARNLHNRKLKLYHYDWLLIVPLVLSFVSYIPYYMLNGADKLADFTNYGGLHRDIISNLWEWNFEIIFNVSLLGAALLEIKKYQQNIKEQLSNIAKVDLHLSSLVIKTCLVAFSLELVFVYMTFFGFPYYHFLFNLFELMQLVILLIIGYDALNSYRHINALREEWEKVPVSEIKVDGQIVKYAKSTLSQQVSEGIRETLLNYMNEHQPYLEPQLRIKNLAEAMDIPSYHLSQVINEQFQQNFYEFINQYRVNYAMELMKNPSYQNFTLVAIGFEVGFNSKSAFYTAFRKITGKTPAKFQNEVVLKS